jgi:hypothetical protein
MRAVLVWLGNAFGALCAGLVVWVVAGTFAGRAIVAWDGRILDNCWPTHSPIHMRLHLETDTAASLVWLVTVAIPSVLVEFPALVVRLSLIDLWPALGRDETCYIVDDWIVTFAPALFALFSITGLIYWYDRARLFALMLFLALVIEIAAIAVFG